MRKTKHRGVARVAGGFLLNLIAYNGELRKDPEAAPNYVEPNFQITPKNSTLERQNLKFPGSHTANDAAHSSASRHWGGWRRINYWAERSQLESGKGFSGGGSLSKFTEGRQKLRKLPSD